MKYVVAMLLLPVAFAAAILSVPFIALFIGLVCAGYEDDAHRVMEHAPAILLFEWADTHRRAA